MNGIDYLIDTNILIYILQGNPIVKYFAQKELLAVSCITEMEALGKYQANYCRNRYAARFDISYG